MARERVNEERDSPVCQVAGIVATGLLFDARRHNGRVRDARLVQAVSRMRHHVRRKPTGYQTRGRQNIGKQWYLLIAT